MRITCRHIIRRSGLMAIRERMTAARLGYRTNQRETIEQLKSEIAALKQENALLKNKLKELGGE